MNAEDGDSKPAAKPSSGEAANIDKMNDEEKRKLFKPSITTEQAMDIMKNLYAKDEGDKIEILTQLESYDDVNFKVSLNGTYFLLKIHNAVESADFCKEYEEAGRNYKQKGHMGSVIHLQTAMMDLLSTNKVPTSAPVPTKEGIPVGLQDLPVVSVEHSPRPLVVRLLTWVNGKLMSAVQLMPIETLADCGRLLGRVHSVFNRLDASSLQSINILQGASQGMTRRASSLKIHEEAKEEMVVTDKIRQAQLWKIPESGLDLSLLKAARRYHQWDGKNTSDLRNFCKYIQDEKRRGMILSIIDAFEQSIINSGDSAEFRVGICHGDFNDANILLKDDLTAMGVIDFGDSTESWRVLDVTVAMAYAMLSTYGKANRGISAAAATLRGYHSVNPLLPVERKHLVLLLCCRLACSVTLGAYSYQKNPENKYLLFHAEPAWKTLEMIWCYNANQRAHIRAAFDRVLNQACLLSKSKSKVIDCSDLVCSDPVVEDLLAPVRLRSNFSAPPPPSKKRRLSTQGLPIITFVTGNFKKLIELREILGIGVETEGTSLPFELNHHKVDLPELQGDQIEIAVQKCKLAAAKVGGAVITEDTSLGFNALDGLPGPYIKWFHDKCGHEGLNKMLDGFEDRSGYAQTVVCFCTGPGQEPAVFDGRTNGKIVRPRGDGNFGWDPIFEPVDANAGKTYAEMTSAEKNAISHRSRALTQLREFLRVQAHVLRDQIIN